MCFTPRRAEHLLGATAFTTPTHSLSRSEKAHLAYDRAKATVRAYHLTMEDVLGLSHKFWELHQDPLMAFDGGAMTLVTIQVNLTAGTIARQAVGRPELVSLVDDLLNYRKHGQFLMTEVGHGLDISNLETTATLMPSGEFVLNTPSPAAAKFMPPTIPAGLPTVGVVWAKLMVSDEDYGVRPFLVPINDGKIMCSGVKSILLPERGGPNPVNHAVTTFSNVCLPPQSILGSREKFTSPRIDLPQMMWRVVCGTMAIGCLTLPIMKCYATIGAMYSLRRHIGGPNNRIPIMHFRTQQIPILTLIAQVYVMEEFIKWGTRFFSDTTIDYRVRHAVAGILKATIVGHANVGGIAISDRCGVQGLFAHNQLTAMHNETRGIAIAEGDVLVLSIKLVTEMLQGRYKVPASAYPESILGQHEAGLFADNRAVLNASSHHRSDEVNRMILPQCQTMIEAVGHRMAYDAAVASGVKPNLIELYVANCMKLDASWYIENAGFTRRTLADMEAKAIDAVLPDVGKLIDNMGVERWVTSKIISDQRWNNFLDTCDVFEGQSSVAMFPGEQVQENKSQIASSRL